MHDIGMMNEIVWMSAEIDSIVHAITTIFHVRLACKKQFPLEWCR